MRAWTRFGCVSWERVVFEFEAGNDNRRQPVFERRSQPRRRVLLTGKIVSADYSFTADCVIRDLSEGGARVVAPADAVCGQPFLIVVRSAMAHRCSGVWHGDGHVGLKFLDATNVSVDVPRHLRSVQALWAQLAPR
jgi:hypothetical protein